ncbi:peptidase domain-containing ABC transporter [Eggerthella lenta]|uniref:peptidase domain-containing ABC transporter n=1 Tax=Eggerthella lenta TaxID=84112 RepID=UPI000DF83CF2|nr:peptidase domain-containing ABC transporter [Eggerthella lenta]RDC08419.1 peptide cleavage/export ABC transporter [Eggerthella lenta]
MKNPRIRKEVFVKQRDEKDCGPACLCSICEYYGIGLSLAKAREICKADSQGTNVYGMVQAAKSLGFEADPLKGSYEDLEEALEKEELALPAIAHVVTPDFFEHYVVVYRIDGKGVLVSDPGVGKRTMSEEEFKAQWTGVMIAFRGEPKPIDDFEAMTLGNLLLRLVAKSKGLVAWVVAASLLVTSIGVASAFLFQYVIDNIVMQANWVDSSSLISSLALVCGAVAILYAVQAGLTSARGYFLSRFSNKLDTSIMMDFYNHLVDLPADFFGTRKTGEIMSRFSDAAKIRDAISSVTFTALIDCVMVVAGAVLLLALSWQLALIAFSLFAAYVVVIRVYSRKLEDANKKLMENNAQLQSHIKESVDGMETVKAFVREKSIKEKAMERFVAVIEQSFKLNVMVNNQGAIIVFFSSVATVAILFVGVSQILHDSMTLGALITFNALVGYFLTPLQRVIGLQPEIQSAFVAMDRLNDINDLSVEDLESGERAEDSAGDIEVKGLDFRYGNRELVLHDIDLKVSKGEKVAIVGQSGSGKTTLAKLLLAFYSPEKGEIMLGGKNLDTLSKRSLREKVAYLSQDTFLFAGTLAENIKFGNPDVDEKTFLEACRQSRVIDFVANMPMGFDTMIEERGANLSGGQKQRIALARVLVRKPEVMILDEATSNLDSITEQAVIDAIFKMGEGATCILIAHRLSTIIGCDRIVLMEDGMVQEVGAHEELLALKGKYYQYWCSQVGKASLA